MQNNNAVAPKDFFTNTDLNLNVKTMLNNDGSISINAEDTALGYGWYQIQKKNGREYTSVRWERMNTYSEEFGFPHKWGKDDYVPESLFYMFGMKANNKAAIDFQKWIAIDVIPSIRKTGSYSVVPSSSTETSLTREEMAMYITVLQETNNEVKNSCLQTMSLISDVLCRQEEMFASQMSSLNKTANDFVINYGKNFDKLLSSIKPQRVENREESFLSEADKLAGIISSKYNMDQDTAYSLVYTKMMQNEGINVYELKTSSSSVIKAVARDPELSAVFERCAKDLVGDYSKQNQKEKVINKSYNHLMTSRTHMMIPAEVKELVSKYQVKTNRKTFQYAMQTILKELCKELGITHADLQKRAKAYARTIGHEKCSIGYLIAHDEELLTTLKKIAEG